MTTLDNEDTCKVGDDNDTYVDLSDNLPLCIFILVSSFVIYTFLLLGNPYFGPVQRIFRNSLNQNVPLIRGTPCGDFLFPWIVLFASIAITVVATYLSYSTLATHLGQPYVSQKYLLFGEHKPSRFDESTQFSIWPKLILVTGGISCLFYSAANCIHLTLLHWFHENQYLEYRLANATWNALWNAAWINIIFHLPSRPPSFTDKHPYLRHGWSLDEQWAG